jgi:hypothetical protein
MSLENVLTFGKLVMQDDRLRKELETAVAGKDLDQAAAAASAVAVQHGYATTPTEVKDGYQVFLNMNKPDPSGELSDAQLEAVAGGGGGKGSSGSSEEAKKWFGSGK